MTDDYTQNDYNRLAAYAYKKSDHTWLNYDDFEDLLLDILTDAFANYKRVGGSFVGVAVRTAMWTRYYTDPKTRAEREAANYHLGSDSNERDSEDDLTGEDLDNATLYDAGWYVPDRINELAIRELIAALPVAQQQAFTLCGELNYTLQEAAAMTGMSVSTVDRNLKRAQATLQAQVKTL